MTKKTFFYNQSESPEAPIFANFLDESLFRSATNNSYVQKRLFHKFCESKYFKEMHKSTVIGSLDVLPDIGQRLLDQSSCCQLQHSQWLNNIIFEVASRILWHFPD